ncbi:MAG TPA: polysaccharide deacetylase family protein [Nitrososphaeraceae archaeon]|jgi:peptidoglycan/xylan/chitin deacetylase (PgdA/CDA1 family)
MSLTDCDPSAHSCGLNFVLVSIILIFLLIPTVLNCNKEYNPNNLGFAISQKHNDDTRVNIISKDNATMLSRNVVMTNGTNSDLHSNASKTTNNDKLDILTFGDTIKSQITTAKPILDQYGTKASFFITCDFASSSSTRQHRMNWNDVWELQKDGQDIESKGMTHLDLTHLSLKDLESEIGGSKQCLENHGVNSPNIFAVVHGDAWDNSTVINTISKYHGFADNGFADLMFLRCDRYDDTPKQTDCGTYNDNGTLTYANRYTIKEDSQNSWDKNYLHNDPLIFQKFVEQVNSQTAYNSKKDFIDAIPIVAYHSMDNSKGPSSTDVGLLASEMKYLHDNGFKVIPMSDLRYDQITKYMYIRNNQLTIHLLSS